MITLTLLGTGGGMPMPERFLSSAVLHFKGRKIIIDCGEGTQVSMRKCKTGFKSIDLICITHLHGDHIYGLPGLLTTMGNSERRDPVTIIGCNGIANVIEGMMRGVPYLPFEIKIIENPNKPLYLSLVTGRLIVEEDKEQTHSEMIIQTMELDHSSPCLGYRFDIKRRPKFNSNKAILNQVPKVIWSQLQRGDRVLQDSKIYEPAMVLGEERKGIRISYITDTRPIESIPDFIRESSLCICEGTYGDDEDLQKAIINKHMTFREAASIAKEGDVQELLLTHFGTGLIEPEEYIQNAKEVFKETKLGYDGFVQSISFE